MAADRVAKELFCRKRYLRVLFVGANTVMFGVVFRVCPKPAAPTKLTNVLKAGILAAASAAAVLDATAATSAGMAEQAAPNGPLATAGGVVVAGAAAGSLFLLQAVRLNAKAAMVTATRAVRVDFMWLLRSYCGGASVAQLVQVRTLGEIFVPRAF